ncbi:hypothetical protein FRB91_009281 [Serendipita sp. 411]|nr:hypothetical protein FRB91_009281 [Serendipita sp. 411]
MLSSAVIIKAKDLLSSNQHQTPSSPHLFMQDLDSLVETLIPDALFDLNSPESMSSDLSSIQNINSNTSQTTASFAAMNLDSSSPTPSQLDMIGQAVDRIEHHIIHTSQANIHSNGNMASHPANSNNGPPPTGQYAGGRGRHGGFQRCPPRVRFATPYPNDGEKDDKNPILSAKPSVPPARKSGAGTSRNKPQDFTWKKQAKDQIRNFWKLPPAEVSIPALPITPSLSPPSPLAMFGIVNSQEYQHRESRSGRSAAQQCLTSQEGAPIQLLYVEGSTIVRLTPQAWDILKVDPAFRLIYWRDDPAEPRNAPKPTRAV